MREEKERKEREKSERGGEVKERKRDESDERDIKYPPDQATMSYSVLKASLYLKFFKN